MDRTGRHGFTWTWLALAIATPIFACFRAEPRPSDTALTALPPAVPTPAPAVDSTAAPPVARPTCLVTDSSIGPVRLGMTVADAKQALPSGTFERSSDGDGAVLIGLTVGGDALMTLAAEDDMEGPIDWGKRIVAMETFSSLCATTDGVHPGSLVLDAEKVLGDVTTIVQSEIESREYIEFERQPAQLTFRLDYTGIFPAGSRETRRFNPKGRIFSIAISTH